MLRQQAQPNTVDYEAIKRYAFRDQNILVVDLNDSRLTWPDKELLKVIAKRLYGVKPPGGK